MRAHQLGRVALMVLFAIGLLAMIFDATRVEHSQLFDFGFFSTSPGQSSPQFETNSSGLKLYCGSVIHPAAKPWSDACSSHRFEASIRIGVRAITSVLLLVGIWARRSATLIVLALLSVSLVGPLLIFGHMNWPNAFLTFELLLVASALWVQRILQAVDRKFTHRP